MTTHGVADRSTTPGPDPGALDDLRRSVRGEVITSDDEGYETHRRVWNGSIDRRPQVIVRCTSPDDVRAAVGYGRRHDLPIALRGGGHSFPGLSTCDDGLLVDLRPMADIRVDPEKRIASAGAGMLLGEVDDATQRHGLAIPAGIVSHTGLAGLTLGGGIGWIMRRHGLTVDQLAGVEMVTADGELVHASDDENADLFWALRGGGGNFGVVTRFDFRLVPLGPQILGGVVFWPVAQTESVLRFYRDWIAGCPDDLTTIVVQRLAPALPAVPLNLVGEPVIAVSGCYAGDIEEGERVLAPLRAFGSPVLDLFGPKSYLDHQMMFNPSYRHGCWYYVRSCDVAALSDGVIDVMTEYGRRITSPVTTVALWQLGGQVSRVGDDETAFNGRHTAFTFNINGNTETADGFDQQREWARDYWSALSPFHQSVYVNFLMEEGEERVKQAYGEQKYERLKQVKRTWDPANVFRLNQNIRPD
jgi:FAD/FMN-containing dehydrogenase